MSGAGMINPVAAPPLDPISDGLVRDTPSRHLSDFGIRFRNAAGKRCQFPDRPISEAKPPRGEA